MGDAHYANEFPFLVEDTRILYGVVRDGAFPGAIRPVEKTIVGKFGLDLIYSVCYTKTKAMKTNRTFEVFLKKKGISQSEAARRLGVPHPTVWRWIDGKHVPSPLAKASIKEHLGFAWKA